MLVRIMYIMLNTSGHFKRRVKTAGFVHIKKLLDHKQPGKNSGQLAQRLHELVDSSGNQRKTPYSQPSPHRLS